MTNRRTKDRKGTQCVEYSGAYNKANVTGSMAGLTMTMPRHRAQTALWMVNKKWNKKHGLSAKRRWRASQPDSSVVLLYSCVRQPTNSNLKVGGKDKIYFLIGCSVTWAHFFYSPAKVTEINIQEDKDMIIAMAYLNPSPNWVSELVFRQLSLLND